LCSSKHRICPGEPIQPKKVFVFLLKEGFQIPHFCCISVALLSEPGVADFHDVVLMKLWCRNPVPAELHIAKAVLLGLEFQIGSSCQTCAQPATTVGTVTFKEICRLQTSLPNSSSVWLFMLPRKTPRFFETRLSDSCEQLPLNIVRLPLSIFRMKFVGYSFDPHSGRNRPIRPNPWEVLSGQKRRRGWPRQVRTPGPQ
jgi:hypothetical protein